MKKINVKNKKQFTETISRLRNEGYMIITFCKRFAELENDNELVVIEY